MIKCKSEGQTKSKQTKWGMIILLQTVNNNSSDSTDPLVCALRDESYRVLSAIN